MEYVKRLEAGDPDPMQQHVEGKPARQQTPVQQQQAQATKTRQLTVPTTADEAVDYLDQVAEADCPCVHGHHGCAAWDNGPCSDEIMSLFDIE